MNIENIPLWPIISVLIGILYFGWLILGGDLKNKAGQIFLNTPAFLKNLRLGLHDFFEKTGFSGEVENGPEINLRHWQTWLEWGLIVMFVSIYCLPFLDLGTLHNLPGLETENFQAFDQILEFSIKDFGQFPLWNPYFHTGIPYIAHPMLHAYNPFISIPVLLFGALDGFKLAVFLGFVIAGLGMWWLGKETGLGGAARIWVALMYAFSGVPAAKFIQGQYLMVMAFGWIPFSLAAILAATHRKRRVYICLAALGLGLLFFCGNVYYAYYLLYVLAIYAMFTLFKFQRTPISLKVDWGKLKVLLVIACLALGLIAIQLLPLLQYRDHFYKAINTDLSDSRDIPTVFMDFVSPEPFRPGAYSYALRPEEFYAYVGWWPLMALLLIPLAWNKNNRRLITLFLALIAFTFLWIDVKDMPWHAIFQTTPFLFQFRYPSRMMVVGVLALIMAASFGLNSLLLKSFKNASWGKTGNLFDCIKNTCILLGLAVFMVWSISNLAATSRPLLQTVNNNQVPGEQAMLLLKELDPAEIYYLDVSQGWDRAVIGAKVRYKNIWDAIILTPDFGDQISERLIEAKPKYLMLANDLPVPKAATLIKSFDLISLYKMKDSLPFAFTVTIPALTTTFDEKKLNASEVTAATSIRQNINSIEGVVATDTETVLVVLSSFSPDWQLTVDGKPEKLYDASGYLAAVAQPGAHYYVFTYQPIYFYVGLFITLSTLCLIFGILIGEMKRH